MLRIRLMAAALCMTLLLGGCAGGKEDPQSVRDEAVQQLSGDYTAALELHTKGVSASARFDQAAPGTMSIEFTAPKAIEGLIVKTQDEWVELSYKGLSGRFTLDQLLDSSVAKQLVRILSALMGKDGTTLTLDEEQLVVQGPAASGTFYLRIARDTKNLLSISIPEQELEIRFSDFLFGRAPAQPQEDAHEKTQEDADKEALPS